jgi:glutamine amidotransferase
MTESEEGGKQAGLNILSGKVLRFPGDLKLKVPHMGWNSLKIRKDTQLFRGVREGSFVYFVHSYYVVPEKPRSLTAASTDYGITFTSSIERENIFATQFHPEKSQAVGLKILKNFVKL